MKEINGYYVNKDRSVDIYIGPNMTEEVITLSEELLRRINLALSKESPGEIILEQTKQDNQLIEENNWGAEMHPDYPKC